MKSVDWSVLSYNIFFCQLRKAAQKNGYDWNDSQIGYQLLYEPLILNYIWNS